VGGEAVDWSSRGGELRTGGPSAEMISDGRSYANRQIVVKRLGENLLPPAQSRRLLGLWLPVAAINHKKRS